MTMKQEHDSNRGAGCGRDINQAQDVDIEQSPDGGYEAKQMIKSSWCNPSSVNYKVHVTWTRLLTDELNNDGWGRNIATSAIDFIMCFAS